MTAVAEVRSAIDALEVNTQLVNAIVSSAENGVQMAGSKARCVAVSTVPVKHSGQVTGLVGLHGAVSGFISLNAPENLSLHLVGGLLGEHFDRLNAQVIDGVGELSNIVAGGVKAGLAGTEWGFSQLTVPSTIVGDGYQVAFGKGMELVNVTFDVDFPEAIGFSDRMLDITLSLLRV